MSARLEPCSFPGFERIAGSHFAGPFRRETTVDARGATHVADPPETTDKRAVAPVLWCCRVICSLGFPISGRLVLMFLASMPTADALMDPPPTLDEIEVAVQVARPEITSGWTH